MSKGDKPWDHSRTTHRHPPSRTKIRWVRTASNSWSSAIPNPQILDRLFKMMGFSLVAKHRSKNVMLYRQGDINFIVNAQPGSFAEQFASQHGPSAPAMAFRVVDAKHAYERALSLGAKPVRRPDRSQRARNPRHRGHRRLADLSRRSLRRKRARSTMWTSNGWAKPTRSPRASACTISII